MKKWNRQYSDLTNAKSSIPVYQRGTTATMTVTASSLTEIEVVFPKAFTNIPAINVYANWTSAGNKRYVRIVSASKTGFKAAVVNDVSQNWDTQITWIASGL